MAIDRSGLIEFEPYINIRYKGVELQEIVFFAKQGEEEAREEYFNRIQRVIDMLSKVYAKQTGIAYEDFLHELYICAHRALNTYQDDQGEFNRFIRSYLSNGAKWYTARRARAKRDDLVVVSYEETSGGLHYFENTIPDPDSQTPLIVAERVDDEKYVEYSEEYIKNKLDQNDKELLNYYLYSDVSPKVYATYYNLSFSGVYRHIKTIFKSINKFILNKEKDESEKNNKKKS